MQVEFCQIVCYINRFPNIEPTLLFLDKSIGHGILFSWYDININHIIIIVLTNILFWIFPLIFKHILLSLVILNSFSRLLMIFSLTIYSIEYEGCLCFLKVANVLKFILLNPNPINEALIERISIVMCQLLLCDKSLKKSMTSNNHHWLFIMILWLNWDSLLLEFSDGVTESLFIL